MWVWNMKDGLEEGECNEEKSKKEAPLMGPKEGEEGLRDEGMTRLERIPQTELKGSGDWT